MTKSPISTDFKIGILGGGQLGKMLIQAASKLDLNCHVLDPDKNCPASNLANGFTQGDFRNYDDVLSFGKNVDLLTIEIEAVNTDALKELQKLGKQVHPSPEIIDTIKDKGLQKTFYRDNGIKTSSFEILEGVEAIRLALESHRIHFPFVWKSCRDGYDGRGVALVRKLKDLDNLADVPAVIEDLVDIQKEIAVLIARNHQGELHIFDPVEMEFSEEANLVELLIAPARLNFTDTEKALSLAEKVSTAFGHVGLLAVEMFLTHSGELLVNEVAPRPHNSGHHTIEANKTSQYEQHLRAILGLPGGSTERVQHAVMINLLGAEGFSGPVQYRNMDKALQMPGTHVHIYGKKQTKPFRKMGHITLCGNDSNELIQKAKQLKNEVRVES